MTMSLDYLLRQKSLESSTTLNRLYKPLNFAVVRAPLLPIEYYISLQCLGNFDSGIQKNNYTAQFVEQTLANPLIYQALAVGSPSLSAALEQSRRNTSGFTRQERKLLRYLIRMSTRPTPYGLFAGVALAKWDQKTDLALASSSPCLRTRPDMGWLHHLIMDLESQSEVRKYLCFVSNPMAFIRADRVFLAERAPIDKRDSDIAASIRATGVVKRTLNKARQPVPYQELVDYLLTTSQGATVEKVEALIHTLWEQTFLLTDLRLQLTTNSPVRYVTRRLAGIPGVDTVLKHLESILDTAKIWDTSISQADKSAYQSLSKIACQLVNSETPLQVDMALPLAGCCLNQAIGDEVAYAAELLLRLTSCPRGLPHITAYRHAFVSRYGLDREVPLLELLDPNFGLGPPAYNNLFSTVSELSPAQSSRRNQTLLHLASSAIRDRRLVVELEEEILKSLETWTPSSINAPISLDIYAFVAASSAKALDKGQFQVVIGPNIGAKAAGRNLGRFADLLGQEAYEALKQTAKAEQKHSPDQLWAELVYMPKRPRSANVAVRPAIRNYELDLVVSPGISYSQVIPFDELVVGVKNDRFYLRWLSQNVEVKVCTGHMLNNYRAPAICQLLAELNQDGLPQLQGFDWGPAERFPFLPRIQVGRIVLRPAQWRINQLTLTYDLSSSSPEKFQQSLEQWRIAWRVPRYVYLSLGDNRLLLDLENSCQAEELRIELQKIRNDKSILLQEMLPALDQNWVKRGRTEHFVTEFVVPLVLQREAEKENSPVRPVIDKLVLNSIPYNSRPLVSHNERLRTPSSNWLFMKLYCGRDLEEDLIAGPIRVFSKEAISSGLAEKWFFVRYSDPDPHIRLRFQGSPSNLTQQLLPKLSTWAAKLVKDELCLKFSIDTYEPEIERYGGPQGVEAAESLFDADSRMVAELFHCMTQQSVNLDRITIAIICVDDLLASLGLSTAERLLCYQKQVYNQHAVGMEYRQRQRQLRLLLSNLDGTLLELGGKAIVRDLKIRRATLSKVAKRLDELCKQGALWQTSYMLYSSFMHMQCNRLLGTDRMLEQKVFGLLLKTRVGLEKSPVL